MASTVVVYAGDGVTKQFTVPFDYLNRSFVHVYLSCNEETQGVTWSFLSPTVIERSAAPLRGETLTIRRITPSNRLIEFKDASVLRSLDLNTSQLQILHIAEEAKDMVVDTISSDIDGNLDARWRRIVHVSNPVGDGDAMNLGTYKADRDGAIAARDRAENAANRAQASATEAQGWSARGWEWSKASEASADKAKASETTAVSSAATAVSASNLAESVKTEAEGIRTDIRTESSAFDAKLTEASGHVDASSANADNAQMYASATLVAETNAKNSEVNAKSSETTTAGYVNTAKGYAENAKNSADSAKNSETTAVASAATAVDAANLAGTVKTEAEGIRTDIRTESTSFDTKLAQAQGYASTAGTEAYRAKTEADRAKASADSVDVTVFENRVTTLEGDNTTNKTNISSLQSDNATNQSRLTTLESDNSTNKTAITNLNNVKLSNTGGDMTGSLNVRGASLRNVHGGLDFSTNGSKTGLTFEWCDGSGKTWNDATNAIMSYHQLIKDTSMNEWLVGYGGGWKVNNVYTYRSLHLASSGKVFVDRNYELRYVRQAGGTLDAWWRLWSDGWIEQGGSAILSENGTVNYTVPFNQLYGALRCIMITPVVEGKYWDLVGLGAKELSKTSFEIHGVSWTGTNRINWYAQGY